MDKQKAEIEKTVPDAQVERQGEGLIVTFSSNVLFAFDKSDLTDQSKNTIQDLYKILNQYPDENVLIVGHTDDIGAADYNQQLSERRASSVASYLTQLGIDASRISTKGKGETEPKYPNDTDAHRAANRRVEFAITANQKMQQEAKEGNLQ